MEVFARYFQRYESIEGLSKIRRRPDGQFHLSTLFEVRTRYTGHSNLSAWVDATTVRIDVEHRPYKRLSICSPSSEMSAVPSSDTSPSFKPRFFEIGIFSTQSAFVDQLLHRLSVLLFVFFRSMFNVRSFLFAESNTIRKFTECICLRYLYQIGEKTYLKPISKENHETSQPISKNESLGSYRQCGGENSSGED